MGSLAMFFIAIVVFSVGQFVFWKSRPLTLFGLIVALTGISLNIAVVWYLGRTEATNFKILATFVCLVSMLHHFLSYNKVFQKTVSSQ